MKRYHREFYIFLFGIAAIIFAIWQFDRDHTEAVDIIVVETGSFSTLLQPSIGKLGHNNTFLSPRFEYKFDLTTTYPAVTYPGNGFQILLESKLVNMKSGNENIPMDSGSAKDTKKRIESEFNSFVLDLPGLEYSPREPNKVGIDGKVRWQVGPPKEAGVYKGYIRLIEGIGALRGAEYRVRWGNIQDLELEIKIKKSFLFLEKMEILILGFLGSLLTFPVLYKFFIDHIESKKKK